jgi:hypothetical protein
MLICSILQEKGRLEGANAALRDQLLQLTAALEVFVMLVLGQLA